VPALRQELAVFATLLLVESKNIGILLPEVKGAAPGKNLANRPLTTRNTRGMFNVYGQFLMQPLTAGNRATTEGLKEIIMEQMAIFSATLGLSPPWQVTSASFATGSNRLDIGIEYGRGSALDCPLCGGKGTSFPAETAEETWYHDDFLRYVTYLHARVPLMACCCGGRFHLERPWSRAGSKFSRIL